MPEDTLPTPYLQRSEDVQPNKSTVVKKVNRVDFSRGKIPTNSSPVKVRVIEGEILPENLSEKKFMHERRSRSTIGNRIKLGYNSIY